VLPHPAVPELDEESQPTARCWWRLYRAQTPGTFLQGLPRVEGPTEDPVGRGSGGNGESWLRLGIVSNRLGTACKNKPDLDRSWKLSGALDLSPTTFSCHGQGVVI